MSQYEELSIGKAVLPNSDGVRKPIANKVTFSIAAGAANVCNVTGTVTDVSGNAVAETQVLLVWLSDAATGIGLTGTSASGTVTTATNGTDMGAITAKKALFVLTNASGVFTIEITDIAKTTFYVGASVPGSGQTNVSRILATADYG